MEGYFTIGLSRISSSMLRTLKPTLKPIKFSELPTFRYEQESNDYILSFCYHKHFRQALNAFHLVVQKTNFKIWLTTYANLISACSSLRSLENGKMVHNHLKSAKCWPDVILHNHIITMYGKCGSLRDAQKVFDEMPERNAVSWGLLIAAYSQNRREDNAMTMYLKMMCSGFMPDEYTIGISLKSCTSVGDINLGRQLHTHVLKCTSSSSLIAHNALISMYAKFGLISDASTVFSEISSKDLISWGSMISGLSQFGCESESLCCFREMLHSGDYIPNEFIFGSVIHASSNLLQPEYGRQIHCLSIKTGFGKDMFVGSSLTVMYAKSGYQDFAKSIFEQTVCPDIVSWNSIIKGLAYCRDVSEAVSYFSRMRYVGLSPDEITISSLLSACTTSSVLHTGEQLHSYIIKRGLDSDFTVCNSLLAMYTKCSSLEHVLNMFKEFKSKADLVSWNTLLTACLVHSQPKYVFRFFNEMNTYHYKPDYITVTNLLRACAQLTSLEVGKQVHSYALKLGLELDHSVANGLLDLYTKCGVLESARILFDYLEASDVVLWNTLILGYTHFGQGEEALKLFERMITFGIQPNEVTFVGVLTACSHIGLVEQGRQIYEIMESRYGVIPTREHRSCLVNILARAGHLKETKGFIKGFIKQLTFEPDIVVWKTLLSACRIYGDVRIGKWAAKNLSKIDPMKSNGVRKDPGQSWIKVQKKVHTFSVEDVMHDETREIYATLAYLYSQMIDVGRVSGNGSLVEGLPRN